MRGGSQEAWELAASRPRKCIRCLINKDAASFPPFGRKSLTRVGITRLCWTCIETEAFILHQYDYWPHIYRDAEGLRFCVKCREDRPLDEFEKGRRVCRDCRSKYEKERYQEKLVEMRAYRAAFARKRRRESPDIRAKEKIVSKRWREKNRERVKEYNKRQREEIKNDPVRHAMFAEDRRIQHRLRAEREGREVVGVKPRYVQDVDYHLRLPAKPLADFIEGRLRYRQEADKALDLKPVSIREFFEDLGVSRRSFLEWRKGNRAMVQIGIAERVMLNLDAEWEDVWPRARFLELYEGVLKDT